MRTHVKVLAILFIVLSSLGVLAGLIVLATFGGIAGIVGVAAEGRDGAIAVPLLGAIGGFVAVLIVLVSAPGIVAGAGLLNFRPWARILGLILSALNLLNVPFGTALGVYGLWVLLSSETQPLFRR